MTGARKVIAFIFARGGSKGIPGKNIRMIAGKPLIAHAIDVAKQCQEIETVIVSTDDEDIAQVARDYGAETPFMRPKELSTDTAPEWRAWQHAISWVHEHRGQFDVFVSLPCTAPLREKSDVEKCIGCLIRDETADVVLTGTKAARSPYFNMVKLDASGSASLAVEGLGVANRQEAPQLFDLTTVAYVAKPNFILRATRMFDGKVRMIEIPAERAIDIDTPFDFEVAEFLLTKRSQV